MHRFCSCGKKIATVHSDCIQCHAPARVFIDTGDCAGQCPQCGKAFRVSPQKNSILVNMKRLTVK